MSKHDLRVASYGTVDEVNSIVGLVHTKDLSGAVLAGDSERPLASVLRPALLIPETATLEHALREMREQKSQLAIVIDENGGTEGVLSAADILGSVIGMRRRSGAAPVTALESGIERLAGNLPLEDLPAEMRDAWAESGIYTVSGRVIFELGRFPRQGEVVNIEGWRAEIEKVHGHFVVSVLVSRETEVAE